ncbi:S-protein homolog 3-like [Rhododendron vialii]|uniref:S-protein homolog 3-like n=1 Tax=Rhododendron vialii TaxID=182163 RepID=UPI00265F791C|nr:S-protein homolog 3-like [Rhododendron vialii]
MARFLPFVILVFLLVCMQTLCEQGDTKLFIKTTVHIKSDVAGQLRFRCQSGNDDLGNQILSTGGYYAFNFHPSFTTEFFCHFYWNSRDKIFDVYNASITGACEHGFVHYDCYWRVSPTGFFLSDNDKDYHFSNSWLI